MTALIEGWTLTDPNPDAYTMALQEMSTAAPAFRVAPEAVFRPEPSRIVEMALEVDVGGAPVTHALNTLVADGKISELMDRLDRAEEMELSSKIWAELSTAETLRTFLKLEPLDVRSLDRLIERFGELTVDAMLDVLTDAESKATRRVLIDRIVAIGPGIGPQVVARLRDERWFVQRNMLNIIASMKEIPLEFPASEFMQSKDPRVRREALSILFKHPSLRERAICQALSDDDLRTVYMGLSAASRGCPRTAIPLIVARVTDSENDEIQVAAVKVLGSVKGKVAVEALLRIIEPRRSLFKAKLPPKSPGYIAALRAAHSMSDDPRIRRALARAAGSRDPDVVRAATTPFSREADVETK
jgi:HEAT repeat protein